MSQPGRLRNVPDGPASGPQTVSHRELACAVRYRTTAGTAGTARTTVLGRCSPALLDKRSVTPKPAAAMMISLTASLVTPGLAVQGTSPTAVRPAAAHNRRQKSARPHPTCCPAPRGSRGSRHRAGEPPHADLRPVAGWGSRGRRCRLALATALPVSGGRGRYRPSFGKPRRVRAPFGWAGRGSAGFGDAGKRGCRAGMRGSRPSRPGNTAVARDGPAAAAWTPPRPGHPVRRCAVCLVTTAPVRGPRS